MGRSAAALLLALLTLTAPTSGASGRQRQAQEEQTGVAPAPSASKGAPAPAAATAPAPAPRDASAPLQHLELVYGAGELPSRTELASALWGASSVTIVVPQETQETPQLETEQRYAVREVTNAPVYASAAASAGELARAARAKRGIGWCAHTRGGCGGAVIVLCSQRACKLHIEQFKLIVCLLRSRFQSVSACACLPAFPSPLQSIVSLVSTPLNPFLAHAQTTTTNTPSPKCARTKRGFRERAFNHSGLEDMYYLQSGISW